MSTIIQGDQLRSLVLGNYVQGQTQNITTSGAATYGLFEITGGEVLITALWGKVSTAVTVANTVNMQSNPTAGDTKVLVEATDIGTTDTAVGTIVGFTDSIDDPATNGATFEGKIELGGRAYRNLVGTTGQIESVVTGTNPDGVITWYCTWVPLTVGAKVIASTQAAA